MGAAFWAYVGGRYGDQVVREMLSIAARNGDPKVAIERVLHVKERSYPTSGTTRSAQPTVLSRRSPRRHLSPAP